MKLLSLLFLPLLASTSDGRDRTDPPAMPQPSRDDAALVTTDAPPIPLPAATEATPRPYDAAGPEPVVVGTTARDLALAYADAAGRTHPDAVNLGGGTLDGLVLAPGLYRWSTGVSIHGDVTLVGAAGDVWIFQIARDLFVSGGARVRLAGGALPGDVIWQVTGRTTLGPASTVAGMILSGSPASAGAVVEAGSGPLAQSDAPPLAAPAVAP